MKRRQGGQMKDRPYYIAEVRVANDEVLFLDPEDLHVHDQILIEAKRAARRKYGDRVFHLAYMEFCRVLIVGHGGNLARAVTHLRERLGEATEDNDVE